MFRENPERLLALARRVVSKVRRPYTLDPDDLVQEACVVLLELEDAGRRPDARNWPEDTWWIVAARSALMRRDSYYAEWQWANRRIAGAKTHGAPTDPDATPAPEHALTPSSGIDDAVDALTSLLPARLHDIARATFDGTPYIDMRRRFGWNYLHVLMADLKATMQSLDLWPANGGQLRPTKRKRKPT